MALPRIAAARMIVPPRIMGVEVMVEGSGFILDT